MAEHPLLAALLRGERRALARAITLVESTRETDLVQADQLLTQALPHSGGALRLGISGVPGVGKSTFIEAFGLAAIAHGRRVAVLAIDPSSGVSGGSILGDKTRMERLAMHEAAFIRPSPSSGVLGGVAGRTREAMLLCEAAGYDLLLVETVGVGQSETAVAAMTDLFLLLQLPNAGDDLQAIKRGVMEIADLVAVNKADLDPAAARRAALQLGAGLGHRGPAHEVSALTGEGLEALWSAIEARAQAQRGSGERDRLRCEQNVAWMGEAVREGLSVRFDGDARVRAQWPDVMRRVESGQLPPPAAARLLLAEFFEDEAR
ncbi:MAG: methylmalonyl Co-A mutase-associated GTPase MeaB [Steroidobacteraceae bacterium]